MKELDNDCASGNLNDDDEELFMEYVVCGEYELLYLDTYLTELFKITG